MKTLKKISLVIGLMFIVFSMSAQMTTSGVSGQKKGDKNKTQFTRQQDIVQMEQKALLFNQANKDINSATLNKHKSEVLAIMNREVTRSRSDLGNLNTKLEKVDRDSQEGRALRIEIMQMEDRISKQAMIRSNVSSFTIEKAQNPKERSGLRAQYTQFIDSMKTNLKYSPEEPKGKPVNNQEGENSSSSKGSNPNSMYRKSDNKPSTSKQTGYNESYMRYRDRRVAQSYMTNQRNTGLALSNVSKEMKSAISSNKQQEVEKLNQEIRETMVGDIERDEKTYTRLENGELKYSGLNQSLIKNKAIKKEALLRKVKTYKLPQESGKVYSAINEYVQLLKQ